MHITYLMRIIMINQVKQFLKNWNEQNNKPKPLQGHDLTVEKNNKSLFVDHTVT